MDQWWNIEAQVFNYLNDTEILIDLMWEDAPLPCRR